MGSAAELGEELRRLGATIDALEAEYSRMARLSQLRWGYPFHVAADEDATTSAWRHWRSSRRRSGGS